MPLAALRVRSYAKYLAWWADSFIGPGTRDSLFGTGGDSSPICLEASLPRNRVQLCNTGRGSFPTRRRPAPSPLPVPDLPSAGLSTVSLFRLPHPSGLGPPGSSASHRSSEWGWLGARALPESVAPQVATVVRGFL